MFNIDKSIKKMIGGGKTFGGRNDWDGDGVRNKKDCQPRNTMRQDRRFRLGSFSHQVYTNMKGKGWFKVRDVVPLYSEFRDVKTDDYKMRWMSGDASWRLKLMVDAGSLERRPNPNQRGHYEYRVIN